MTGRTHIILPGNTLNVSFVIFIPDATPVARAVSTAFGAVERGHHVLNLMIDNQGEDCLIRSALVKDGKILHLSESCTVVFEKGKYHPAKTPRFYKAGERMPVRKKIRAAGKGKKG